MRTMKRSKTSPCLPVGTVELEAGIDAVRVGLADVVGDAGGTDHRPAEAPVDRLFPGDGVQVAAAFDEDLVPGEQAIEVFEALADGAEHPAAALLEVLGEVHRDAADAEVGGEHAVAGHFFEEVVDALAFAPGVDEARAERADIGAECPEEHEVRVDPAKAPSSSRGCTRRGRALRARRAFRRPCSRRLRSTCRAR